MKLTPRCNRPAGGSVFSFMADTVDLLIRLVNVSLA
jgi:hypothetical protein